MTVQELINQLKIFDPESTVVVYDTEFDEYRDVLPKELGLVCPTKEGFYSTLSNIERRIEEDTAKLNSRKNTKFLLKDGTPAPLSEALRLKLIDLLEAKVLVNGMRIKTQINGVSL